ncbi:uncharacterized protein EDB93DRAFT_1107619 [Suillus bovinus]|uniref:uncharacterized protein n=1 Tax=Suillus bovinus TaxID=48563 RepID=UPI001B87A5D8|nr:uncharacterized protein EDB93DRAFT_1107619 [Suillus bovinus]KAG2133239.1 hypothetical protein EDB93DRAFT_1107619 [Suillus bovinus]
MPHKHSRSPYSSDSGSSSDSSISSMERTYVRPKKSSKQRGHSSKGNQKAKKAKVNNNSNLEVPEEFLAAACAMARCVDLFCNMEKLLRVGALLQQEQATENGELEESEAERESRKKRLSKLSTNTIDRYERSYQQLLQLAPGLGSLITDRVKSQELGHITRKMNAIISGTRSDNATHLKVQIGHYAAPEPLKEALKPTIYNGGSLSRAHMGINHPVLASFLCPISALKDFNKDPAQTRKWMEIGQIRMTAINFLVFLWAGNPPASNYNEDAMHEGPVPGLFPRARPSTALGDDSHAMCSCNASLHDMTTVEAEHIAYACVQAHFAISNKNKWSEADGEFNNRAFYYNIINFICECEDRDWAEGLLKWWNRALFKNKNGHKGGMAITDDNGPGDMPGSSLALVNGLAKMRAQMAARASAAKRPAAPEPRPVAAPKTPRPTIPTPPQSSVTPDPEPPSMSINRSPRPQLANTPGPSKSPAPSELTQNKALSDGDDISTIRKGKKKAPGCPKHVARRK